MPWRPLRLSDPYSIVPFWKEPINPPLTTYLVCTYNRHYHHYYIVACCNMSVALKLDQLYPLLLPILTLNLCMMGLRGQHHVWSTANSHYGQRINFERGQKHEAVTHSIDSGGKKNGWAHTYAEPRRQPKTKEYVVTFERNEQIWMFFKNS